MPVPVTKNGIPLTAEQAGDGETKRSQPVAIFLRHSARPVTQGSESEDTPG